MHDAALRFYTEELSQLPPLDVLEFGSYNINGSVRDAYPTANSWWGIDIASGNGVDEVADATNWKSDKRFDVVVCAEAFEHTEFWRDIILNAYEHLKPGGIFVASCATRSRPAHSAFDGGPLRDGEFYENVDPGIMGEFLMSMDWDSYDVQIADGYFGDDDLYIKAVK